MTKEIIDIYLIQEMIKERNRLRLTADLATLRARCEAQEKVIEMAREALQNTLPRLHGELYCDHPEVIAVEKALAAMKDTSDEAKWTTDSPKPSVDAMTNTFFGE